MGQEGAKWDREEQDGLCLEGGSFGSNRAYQILALWLPETFSSNPGMSILALFHLPCLIFSSIPPTSLVYSTPSSQALGSVLPQTRLCSCASRAPQGSL